MPPTCFFAFLSFIFCLTFVTTFFVLDLITFFKIELSPSAFIDNFLIADEVALSNFNLSSVPLDRITLALTSNNSSNKIDPQIIFTFFDLLSLET